MTGNSKAWEKPKRTPGNSSPSKDTGKSGRVDANPPQEPSPWLNHPNNSNPEPSNSASFVEYLRWMRVKLDDSIPDSGTINSGTILELLNLFENNDLSASLIRLTKRTKRLAEDSFEAYCPWRIRVGGTKGPESMLLPAFDSLGIPYIPSSTLRGIARAMAVKDPTMNEKKIKEIFGDINPESSMGQVIFLDAYPLPGDNNKQGGLMPDMANSIWKWEGTTPPKYNTNPNICISLKNPTFLIGLRRGLGCSDDTLQQVKIWLINGLNQGIGSRVNSGYGTLKATGKLGSEIKKLEVILSISFELQGQLIHGRQRFDGWKRNKNNTKWNPGIAEAEVRAIAFRSMLRYWFRSLALGVLPSKSVRNLELEIFGGIEPNPTTGLFRLEVEVTGKIDNEITEQAAACLSGKLIVRSSSHQLAILNQSPGLDNLSLEEHQNRIEHKRKNLIKLLKTLTWLMFHLGGVGQGARRPCYKRTGSNPLWRGSTLISYPENENDEFWKPPHILAAFHQLFQKRLGEFYAALKHFNRTNIDSSNPRTVTATTNWAEAVDQNCRIVVCQGKGSGKTGKGHALSVLHSTQLFFNGDYDKQLCGGVNPAPSIPSPVWIREIKDTEQNSFHVVTVFGATSGKRQTFLEKLKEKSPSNYLQIWPLPNS